MGIWFRVRWHRVLCLGRIVGMTVVYLVQHGEKQSLPGNPGLTAKGRQQATRTGRWLRGLGVHTLCKRTGSEEYGHARGAGFTP